MVVVDEEICRDIFPYNESIPRGNLVCVGYGTSKNLCDGKFLRFFSWVISLASTYIFTLAHLIWMQKIWQSSMATVHKGSSLPTKDFREVTGNRLFELYWKKKRHDRSKLA